MNIPGWIWKVRTYECDTCGCLIEGKTSLTIGATISSKGHVVGCPDCRAKLDKED